MTGSRMFSQTFRLLMKPPSLHTMPILAKSASARSSAIPPSASPNSTTSPRSAGALPSSRCSSRSRSRFDSVTSLQATPAPMLKEAARKPAAVTSLNSITGTTPR